MSKEKGQWAQVVAQMDQLNEFDREPVPPSRFQGPWRFAAFFAGENIAGTEFVIGALLVARGVSARDVLLGLLIGNALAVLSWTLICAPIATRTRLTLYWYLKGIIGPGATAVYTALGHKLSFSPPRVKAAKDQRTAINSGALALCSVVSSW